MKTNKLISIIIPVYFNEKSLPSLFKRLIALRSKLKNHDLDSELIFVDDGSQDRSLEFLINFKKKYKLCKVIKLTRNFGAVNASKVGLSYVNGDAFTILAADLQDPPDLIYDMALIWLNKRSKFIICERDSRSDPFFKKLFARCYYLFIRLFIIKNYPKGGFDMALMDNDLLPFLINGSKNTFTPILAFWLGFQPTIIKYHRQPRKHGKSSWTFSKNLGVFFDVVIGFSALPLRVASILGFFVSLFSFGYGIMIIINKMSSEGFVSGYPSLVVLITFLFGLNLLIIGLMGEYLVRINNEINKRPGAVIDNEW